MKLSDYVLEHLAKWPDVIGMNESRIVSETGGFLPMELICIKDEIEDTCETHLEEVLCWSIYGCFHRRMKNLYLNGEKKEVYKIDITQKEIFDEFINDVIESENHLLIKEFNLLSR